MAKTYKIFISHSWSHVNDLKSLRNLLESRGYFNVEFTEFPPTDSINSMNKTANLRKNSGFGYCFRYRWNLCFI